MEALGGIRYKMPTYKITLNSGEEFTVEAESESLAIESLGIENATGDIEAL